MMYADYASKKNQEKNASKQNAAAYLKNYTPRWIIPGDSPHKNQPMAVHYINRMGIQKQHQMILLIDAEKAFNKIQRHVMIQNIQ